MAIVLAIIQNNITTHFSGLCDGLSAITDNHTASQDDWPTALFLMMFILGWMLSSREAIYVECILSSENWVASHSHNPSHWMSVVSSAIPRLKEHSRRNLTFQESWNLITYEKLVIASKAHCHYRNACEKVVTKKSHRLTNCGTLSFTLRKPFGDYSALYWSLQRRSRASFIVVTLFTLCNDVRDGPGADNC